MDRTRKVPCASSLRVDGRPGRRLRLTLRRTAGRLARPYRAGTRQPARRARVLRARAWKIAAIGTGISGLTFAAARRHYNPSVEVEPYERARRFARCALSGPQPRHEGQWRHPRPAPARGVREDADRQLPVSNFVFCDQKGTPLLELPSSSDDENLNLRVKRSVLKVALRGAAPDVPIHYGMECTDYTQSESDVSLWFRNGQSVQADYVVAADGVGSALRQQLVGDSKRYLGLTCVGRSGFDPAAAPAARGRPLSDARRYGSVGLLLPRPGGLPPVVHRARVVGTRSWCGAPTTRSR
jgi:2-polyprenyl-6-methoxyphenol hydroxylase-like FAD-dependent oxidoreductase